MAGERLVLAVNSLAANWNSENSGGLAYIIGFCRREWKKNSRMVRAAFASVFDVLKTWEIMWTRGYKRHHPGVPYHPGNRACLSFTGTLHFKSVRKMPRVFKIHIVPVKLLWIMHKLILSLLQYFHYRHRSHLANFWENSFILRKKSVIGRHC